ncbi:MAG TPA: hypothetical protein VKB22_01630 [Gemmatimonadales bacterium]|nr:hypothetical protein [Gemmatimonadales bacterium]
MIDLVELRQALHEADLDGWLLFAFKGLNPVATRVLGLSGLNTRRLFALFPREGEPVVIAHKIELHGLENFPGRVVPYARWSELNQALGHAVAGKTLGMEISPRDAVPYLDRVPHGVVQLLQSMGAKILPSGTWSPASPRDGARRSSRIISSPRRFWPTWPGAVCSRPSGRPVRSPRRPCRPG